MKSKISFAKSNRAKIPTKKEANSPTTRCGQTNYKWFQITNLTELVRRQNKTAKNMFLVSSIKTESDHTVLYLSSK